MNLLVAFCGDAIDGAQGTVLSELIVKFFHGEFTPQGFQRYSGLWKGPPPGNIGKKVRPGVRAKGTPPKTKGVCQSTCECSGHCRWRGEVEAADGEPHAAFSEVKEGKASEAHAILKSPLPCDLFLV